MGISYAPLWKLLIDKKLKKCQLRDMAHISNNTLAKLSKDKPVSVEVLVRICDVLRCDIGDVCTVILSEEDCLDA